MKIRTVTTCIAALSLAACGGDSDGGGGGSGGGTNARLISGEITADTTWTAGEPYILTNLTYVTSGVTLTIEAGVTVQGDTGSALVVTRGGKLITQGTRDEPVVFTSSSDVGNRRSGDWGGVVMLGAARINQSTGTNQIEGVSATDNRGEYGGTDDSHDCGQLRYTRIEFAGFELSTDNELNGLTLGGCGSATTLDYVQVHRGKDDGIELFGGQPNLKHIVLTAIEDDSLDWDQGFSGKIQWLFAQQDPADADNGFEADSDKNSPDAEPRSNPTIYNATLIGANASAGTQNGLILRRGTWATLRNFIVQGFPRVGVDVRDAASAAGAMQSPPALTIDNSIFFENGVNGTGHCDLDADKDDDGMFDEDAFFTAAERNNRMSMDPMLPAPYDLAAPNAVPPMGSPAASEGATPPSDGFFDTSATYVGAFEPGAASWLDGWTAFPQN